MAQPIDVVAHKVSTILHRQGHRHAFLGGYAVSLLGGLRPIYNLDIVVDVDFFKARQGLLQEDSGFGISSENKLIFQHGGSDFSDQKKIVIQIFRGGSSRHLKLPNARNVSLLKIKFDGINIPIVDPAVLVLTKVKRWMFVTESIRPASINTAAIDLQDIEAILKWLKNRFIQINFKKYPEKSKNELLSDFRMLYAKSAYIRSLLVATMTEADLVLIRH